MSLGEMTIKGVTWYLEPAEMQYSFRQGPVGAIGAAFGKAGAVSMDFHIKVKVWTNHECRILRVEDISAWFTPGGGLKVDSVTTPTQDIGPEPKTGCVDSQGDHDFWDRLKVNCSWVIEDTIPLPMWNPFSGGIVALPNPFTSQATITLKLKVYPNGQNQKVRTWEEVDVDGNTQYSHLGHP